MKNRPPPGSIPVVKITDARGREFYSDSHAPEDLMKRVAGWTKIERLQMTEAEYHAIPATIESARLFK